MLETYDMREVQADARAHCGQEGAQRQMVKKMQPSG